MKKAARGDQPGGWDTPQGRVGWLLQERWQNNRSAMARAIHKSVTSIVKVATNGQAPGRELLAAIVEHSDVDAAWLLTGKGSPFREAMPVVERPLAGVPSEQDADIEKITWGGTVSSPSRYWLRVRHDEPVVRAGWQKIMNGDLLLLETDARRFPDVHRLHKTLCVVRATEGDPPRLKLAEATFVAATDDMPERIEADTFDLRPRLVKQYIVELEEGEQPRLVEKEVRKTRVMSGPRAATRTTEVHPAEWDYRPLTVTGKDIVAVCVMIVRAGCGDWQ